MAKVLADQPQGEAAMIPRRKIIMWIGIVALVWMSVSYLYNQTLASPSNAPQQPQAAVTIPRELQNIPPLSESDKSELDSIAQSEMSLYFERSGSTPSTKPYEIIHTGREMFDSGSLGTKTLGILRKINYDIVQVKWYYNSPDNPSHPRNDPFEMFATLKKETKDASWKVYDSEEINRVSP
ncbi:hypothetical protein COY62_02765 [bacterium (Candidatus Howlettbacteria) CG_4_10_14_0_8_um_filter_40_9]|nr:MAG: hypothetical protein COY62_02765 [bacterium (Candidatus Howlettbacteria) CG_4_10_14_0_8_um_filter_40_9]